MVFSPSFHKLRRAQRHIFFKVLSVFDHLAHHRGADVLKLRLRDQQHRFERAVRHIAIDERKLLLGVKIHAVAHAAHEKLRVFAQRVVGQKSAAELSFHIGELLDARAHERELLLVGEHRVRLRPVRHDGHIHAVKELRCARDNVLMPDRHRVERAGKHCDSHASSSTAR